MRLATAALLLATVLPAHAILLDDPAYEVKQTWTAVDLGVPANLGGLLFSVDGSTLYLVGDANEATSAVWAIPVTRDGTGGVVDLGVATKAFDGTAATPGLDAALDFGPAGTLFYNYWPANRLAERPGGIGGSETQFDLATSGVPSSIAGLAFSPHRIDPSSGFGRLQVTTNDAGITELRDIYEIPLTPAGGGLFTPGSATLFVRVPLRGLAGLHYVPAGPLAGNLMYVNWDLGELRILGIDAASGLPIDGPSGLPMLGTVEPVESRFASDFGEGPLGIEFDPLTNDLFVATWEGIPFNSVVQIGGFETTTTLPGGSTTTSPATTTTTLPPRVITRLLGGGNPATDCYATFELEGAVPLPSPTVAECLDGDAACDHDGACNDACRFRVSLCLNDDRDPGTCAPPVSPPLGKVARKGAAAALQPPALDQTACGPAADIDVRVKLKRGGRVRAPGKTKLKVVAVAGKRDKDRITLRCLPREGACP